jgi:hypothetical protein
MLASALWSLLMVVGQAVADPFDWHPFVEPEPVRLLHVAPQGSDSSGDGSADRPWRTLRHAADRATPGTAIRLAPGDYPGGTYIENLQGTPEAPVMLGGPPGGTRPRILGGTNGIQLSRCRFVVLHDLEVTGASGNGINGDDGGETTNPNAAGPLVFRRLTISDIGGSGNQDGLKLSGIRGFLVEDVEIARCGGNNSGSGIDMVGCHEGVIRGSRFRQMSGNAIQAKGGSADVSIVGNHFEDGGVRTLNIGGSTGFAFFRPPLSSDSPNAEARRIRVHANVLVGGTAAVGLVGAVDCEVSHNTIVEPSRYVFRILQETPTSQGFAFEPCGRNAVRSNLILHPAAMTSGRVSIGAGTAPESFTWARNGWFAPGGVAAPSPPVAFEVEPLTGIDPQVGDRSGGDYRPLADSLLLGRGEPLSVPARDFLGRPFADPPAIGAFAGP